MKRFEQEQARRGGLTAAAEEGNAFSVPVKSLTRCSHLAWQCCVVATILLALGFVWPLPAVAHSGWTDMGQRRFLQIGNGYCIAADPDPSFSGTGRSDSRWVMTLCIARARSGVVQLLFGIRAYGIVDGYFVAELRGGGFAVTELSEVEQHEPIFFGTCDELAKWLEKHRAGEVPPLLTFEDHSRRTSASAGGASVRVGYLYGAMALLAIGAGALVLKRRRCRTVGGQHGEYR